MPRIPLCIVALTCLAAVPACSNNDSSNAPSGTGGTSGASGTGAQAGTGGIAGAGGDADAALDADAAPLLDPAKVGATCAADADCGPGLICLTPDSTTWRGGGPAHGYCTKDCTTSHSCKDIDADMQCVANILAGTATHYYCLEPCSFAVEDASKCHGRTDVACATIWNTSKKETVCTPLCLSDDACESPLRCDPQFRVCTSAPTTGDPLGTYCEGLTCEGMCMGITLDSTVSASDPDNAASFCTKMCILGQPLGCGDDGSCAMPEVTNGTHTPGTTGDLGFCIQRCDTLPCRNTQECAACVDHGAEKRCEYSYPKCGSPDAGAEAGQSEAGSDASNDS